MEGAYGCGVWGKDARLNYSSFVFYAATYTDPKERRYNNGPSNASILVVRQP